jgi:hypothetical protein
MYAGSKSIKASSELIGGPQASRRSDSGSVQNIPNVGVFAKCGQRLLLPTILARDVRAMRSATASFFRRSRRVGGSPAALCAKQTNRRSLATGARSARYSETKEGPFPKSRYPRKLSPVRWLGCGDRETLAGYDRMPHGDQLRSARQRRGVRRCPHRKQEAMRYPGSGYVQPRRSAAAFRA